MFIIDMIIPSLQIMYPSMDRKKLVEYSCDKDQQFD